METKGTEEPKKGKGASSAGSAKAGETEETPKQEAGAGSTGGASTAGAGTKRNVEDRLDDFADKFSHAMSEGVKRMEEAFDRGMENLKKQNPNLSQGKIKNFFLSSTGGAVLLLLGFVWLFYAVGLLDNKFLPILLIVLGFYLMYRSKSSG